MTDPQPEASGPSPAAGQPDRRRWAIRIVALVLIVAGVTLLVRAANRPKDPVLKPAVRTAMRGFGEISYRIDTMSKTTRCGLLADTPEQQHQGLMHVTDATLGGHDGMLFRFSEVQRGAFWMKDTILPLSIAYFIGCRVGSAFAIGTIVHLYRSGGTPLSFSTEMRSPASPRPGKSAC